MTSSSTSISATTSDGELGFARAKVNLCLHVVGQRDDGYHLLDSLAVFPGLGDRLTAEPASGLSLTLRGPFALDLDAGGDNLALRAALALDGWATARGDGRARGAALTLDKTLPIASGIGGGSADAAAALRVLCGLWDLCPSAADLAAMALPLGADVPVCLGQRAAWMRGVGERLAPAPALPPFWLVLANPGVAVPTPAIFKALSQKNNPPPPPPPERFAEAPALVRWLAETRNDLEAPAVSLRPEIAGALSALSALPGCALARMSGSGATCFGIFATETLALSGADALRSAEPGWWVAAAPVGE